MLHSDRQTAYLPELLSLDQITDLGDRMNIIRLWEERKYRTSFRTRACHTPNCPEFKCQSSHSKIMGIPIIRCLPCIYHDCGKEKIFRVDYKYDGKNQVLYVVCRRIAWILEDEIIRSNNNHNLLKFLEEAKLNSTISNNGEFNREKRQRDGEFSFYDFLPTPVTKRALIHLIENDDFDGIIRINGSYLKDSIIKLSDVDITSLAPELKPIPDTTFAIERAKIRIELDALRGQAQPKV